jgi:murein DD-endopeptidase MepM/ murein hydrolase activator NlpD
VGGSALISEDGPSGTAADIETAMPEATAISVYTVHKGDTLSGIAKMFGVTPNTITWANDIKKGTLKEGMELVILPVTGVRYTVQKGDTVASVAKKYKADATDITQYNTLEGALAVGETIIIPDGEVIVSTPVRSTLSSKAKIPSVRVTGSIAVSGYFSWPVQGGVVTQGIHGYNGIDIGAARGVSIFAAAAGTVIVARDGGGWNGGYGNYIVIKHDNGTQTLYAHANSVSVSSGQYVSQGAVIGTVGNTGKSTGTHLHFEVRGAVNPFGM